MKNFFKNIIILFVSIVVMLLFACEKDHLAVKDLYSGSGAWLIESIQFLEFDSGSNVILDSFIYKPGEFTFFSSKSWNGIDGYYIGTFIDYNNHLLYPIEYAYDKYRVFLTDFGDPYGLGGYYDVQETKNKKQIWTTTESFNNFNLPSNIRKKTILSLKRIKL